MNPSYPIVFYISGHGFGHSSRTIEVIQALLERHPDVSIVVKTAAPRTFFDRGLDGPYEFIDFQCDPGMIQIDALNLDAAESLRQAKGFYAQLEDKITSEAAFLRARGARLVVGDIPPLAFGAARAAELPSVAIGNFTWDWIYEGYPEQSPQNLAQLIRDSYRNATVALRLPASGGFEGLEAITRDIPFIARRSNHDPLEVRRRLGLPLDRPLVLVSFGGYGVSGLNTSALAALRRYAIVTTDLPSREHADRPLFLRVAGLHYISEDQLSAGGYKYQDLVRAADVVATKPGYGILTDAMANDTAVLYTSRGHFVEYEVLVRAMPRYVRSEFIDQENLLSGNWGPYLDRLLASPPPHEKPDLNGASIAAKTILEIAGMR
jgi:UDP:flavonoid glycosyltransferase YjiC (YdhE family)